MVESYDQFLRDPPFRFIVGEERQEFFLHPKLVSDYSKPLGALVHGSMREAKERCASLDDITPSTFARVSQYIYTGDYPAADHFVIATAVADVQDRIEYGHKVSEDTLPPAPVEEVGDHHPVVAEPSDNFLWGGFTSTSSKSKKAKKGSKFRPVGSWDSETVKEEQYEKPAVASDPMPDGSRSSAWHNFIHSRHGSAAVTVAAGPRPNTEPSEEYTRVFLSHARVYTFAHRYDVAGLREPALHELHQTLINFTLYVERIRDVCELLCYVYENTADRLEAGERLRELVLEYVVCHIERVYQDAIVITALKQEGALSVDLVGRLTRLLMGDHGP